MTAEIDYNFFDAANKGAFAMVNFINHISLTYYQNVLDFAQDKCAIKIVLYKDLAI